MLSYKTRHTSQILRSRGCIKCSANSLSGAYLPVTAKDMKFFVAFKKSKIAESFCNVQLGRGEELKQSYDFLLDVFLLIFSVMIVFPRACVHLFLT